MSGDFLPALINAPETTRPCPVRRPGPEDEPAAAERGDGLLRPSEQEFRLLVEGIDCVFWIISTDLDQVFYISPAYEKVWGRSCQSLYEQPRSWLEAVHPDDVRQVEEAIRAARQQRSANQGDLVYRILRSDGTLRWIRARAFLVPGEQGARDCFIGLAEDITDRKQMEEALRLKDRALECSATGIAFASPDGLLTYVNQSALRMWGYADSREMLGRPCAAFWHDPAKAARVSEQLRRHGSWTGELVARRKDGSCFPVELSANLVTDAAGEPVCMMASCIDVTARKQAEERLQHLQAQLAHVDRLATMGELASGLAHELNQPLTAIATYTRAAVRLLRAGTGDPGQLLQALEQAARQAERAGEVVHRLRRFVARAEPHRSLLDLNELVREALLLSEYDLRDGGVHVQLDLREPLPPVEGDRIQLEQVILNLIRNAVEAMADTPPGQRNLTIITGPTGQGTVEVAVCDAGCGLTVEMVQRLFQPFQTTKPQGMGLGLAISRSIIQAHGGWMWARPNPERGATFSFALPIAGGTSNHGAPADRLPR
ncbi:MAG TPA: PAS domain S-box protein [Gemmataceae bacterium]|nr:PAS domain S-box protein [Gemmataceae bacterium]